MAGQSDGASERTDLVRLLRMFQTSPTWAGQRMNRLKPNTHRRCRRDSTRRRRCVLNSELAHDDCRWVRSHLRHDATRLRRWQTCSEFHTVKHISKTSRATDLKFRLFDRLLPTSCEFRTHLRRDLTRQLSRVGVGGVYCL